LTSAIEDGKRTGSLRPEVDPEAYLVQSIVMIVGSFVAADLGAAVFGSSEDNPWAERQRTEARRMAQHALFFPRT
jgi:hypothetical protein